MPDSSIRTERTIVFAALWVAAVGLGMAELLRYSNQVGFPASSPRQWPQDSIVVPATDRPTLVMLLHPQCPCSHAAVEELAIVRARAGDFFAMHVIFLANEPFETRSSLWRAAQRIPGVTIPEDRSGFEVERFGAETSGQVLTFSANRNLIHSGRITSARGHTGPNRGRDALLALSRGEQPEFGAPPALGYALRDRRQTDNRWSFEQ